MDSGHTVASGQWTVDSGQWTVDSGQRTVDSGKLTCAEYIVVYIYTVQYACSLIENKRSG